MKDNMQILNRSELLCHKDSQNPKHLPESICMYEGLDGGGGGGGGGSGIHYSLKI